MIKKILILIIVAFLVTACATNSKSIVKRELAWNKTLTTFHEIRIKPCLVQDEQGVVLRDENGRATFDGENCSMDREEVGKVKALVKTYRTAAKTFQDNPEVNACKMATVIADLSPLVGVDPPNLGDFCLEISEFDRILAEFEANDVDQLIKEDIRQ